MKHFYKDERGSMVVESALVLPIIFVIILLLMFFCLFLYQNTVTGQAAAVAAERAAFSWNNSYRDPGTGSFEDGEHDALYWRLTGDDLLQAVWDGASSSEQTSAALPVQESSESNLAVKKLQRTAAKLPEHLFGTIGYSHHLMSRFAEAKLQRQLPASPLNRLFGKELSIRTASSAYIVEPSEWIRSVELARYFAAKFKTGQGGVNKQDAAKALAQFGKP